MALTLQEQLAALPIPRLTTVLRVNFDLLSDSSFPAAINLVENWWNRKAEPYGTKIEPHTSDLSFDQEDFKIEFAKTDAAFALAMQEPDSSVAGRSWICDFSLRKSANRSEFAVRVSFRQTQDVSLRPEPRAPRFLRDIVDLVGAIDTWQLKSSVQLVDVDSVAFLEDLIDSRQRTLPVVAISEDDRTNDAYENADTLARFLCGAAHVVRLTSDASWQLSRHWGRDWSTFQGAIRCYNATFSRTDDKYRHRLWLPDIIRRMDATSKNGFLNVCVGYVFTQVTAQFESLPLLTPSVLRRQVEEAARSAHKSALAKEVESPGLPDLVTDSSINDKGVSESSAVFLDDALRETRIQLHELSEANAELELRLRKQEENSRLLEEALQQERAGRAEAEKASLETKEDLELYIQEVKSLEQQKSIALGDLSSEQSALLRPLWQSFNGFFNNLQNVASQFRRLEEESHRSNELQHELSAVNVANNNLRATIESINRKQRDAIADLSPHQVIQHSGLLDLLPQLALKNPPLEASLKVVSIIFPDRVAVLKSAYESASQSYSFRHGDKAFELLWALSTCYWQQIQSGSGDAEARKVFGNAYAPRESEKMSKAGQARREFLVEGSPVIMEKHLRIGTADNLADTVRIHFEWIAEKKLIVIGHCGRHLDF